MAGQQFNVQFFQFNPKDLAIRGLGGKPRRKEHSKRSYSDTLPPKAQNASVVNATTPAATGAANATAPVALGNATAATPAENATINAASTASDTDIMNTLINRAIIKKNATDAQNTTVADDVKVEATNATSNDTTSSNTTVAKETVPSDKPSKKSVIANVAGKPRKNVLNPNPKPSEQDAMLNIKQPKQLEGKPHDGNIHSENTTKVSESENKHTVTTNAVSMEKNNNTVVPETDNSTQNVTTNTEEDEKEKQRLAKLEKDKQTNKEIKEKAKEIKPVENTVGNINNSIKNVLKDDNQTGRSKVDHADAGKIKHRNNVAKFVPLYKTSAKDHKLSFQIGSMKHPKHNIHPKCHACPHNSTYKECVKKSTLLECNQGLDNICFTKSSKKNGVITYQMGCADHNKCVNAKAFPCKGEQMLHFISFLGRRNIDILFQFPLLLFILNLNHHRLLGKLASYCSR